MNEDRRNVYDSAEINDQQEEYKAQITGSKARFHGQTGTV